MNTHEIIADLQGARLELQDDFLVEQLWFGRGSVTATLGAKDGPICGPTLDYRIMDDGAVEIIGSDGEVFYRWEDARIENKELLVSCEGKLKRFSISRVQKKERRLP